MDSSAENCTNNILGKENYTPRVHAEECNFAYCNAYPNCTRIHVITGTHSIRRS